MKILFLAHLDPVPPNSGGKLRVYHLAKGLASKHELTLVTVRYPYFDGPEAKTDELFQLCHKRVAFTKSPASGWWNISQVARDWGPLPRRLWALCSSIRPARIRDAPDPELVALLRSLRTTHKYDAVWVSTDFMAESAARAGFERIVLDIHDLDCFSYLSILRCRGWYMSKILHYAEFAKIWFHEKRLPNRFWRLVISRPEDLGFFKGSEDRVHVVPNGVATFEPTSASRERPGELLFLGTLYYQPNIDAVQYFCRSILPFILQKRSDARFVVAGLGPTADVLALHNGTTIDVVGTVEDVTSLFESASIVVAPIRSGGGTRLKVLEALARGKAVVSTRTGMEGLDLRAGEDLLVADTPVEFAEACVGLLGDADKRQRIAQAGRRRALERYHWDNCVAAAERALGITVDSEQSRAAPSYAPANRLISAADRVGEFSRATTATTDIIKDA